MKTRASLVVLGTVAGLAVALVCLLVGRPGTAGARSLGCVPGPHNTIITADETWCLVDSPHLVNGWVTVLPTVTLTIEPGVIVTAVAGRDIEIQGHLEAAGTPAQPITFTSQADTGPEQWAGLIFNGGSGHLDHVTVRYAGYENRYNLYANVAVVAGSAVTIENSRILSATKFLGTAVDYGMYVFDSRVTVCNTLFSGNCQYDGQFARDYPLYIEGAASAITLTYNTIVGNPARDDIGIAPGAMAQQPSITLARQTKMGAYEFDGVYTVLPTQTLILEPGVTVSGRSPNGELIVRGHLEAAGTPTLPITLTSGDDNAWQQWAGVVFDGGTGHLQHVVARYGGVQGSLFTYGTINALNVPPGGLRIEESEITRGFYYGLEVVDSHVTVRGTRFANNVNYPPDGAALYAAGPGTAVTLTGSLFEGNGRGMLLTGGGHATLVNNIFDGRAWAGAVGNDTDGLRIDGDAFATLRHTTFAGNKMDGLNVGSVAGSGVAVLTNTILAENGVGVRVEGAGAVTLSNTLYDRNVYGDIVGPVSETGHVDGPAGFAPDGYHLTRYSTALQRGVEAGVAEDLDGEARPAPTGTAPDLGADEYPFTFGDDFAAEKTAFDPQWVILPDSVHGDPSGYLRQRYYIRYFYGSSEPAPPGLTVYATDTLPAALSFEGQETIPAMDFSQDGQTLTWRSQQPLQLDQSGEIVLSGLYAQPVPGDVLTNHAKLRAGEWWFDLQASAEVPLFPPLITFPGDGEICTLPGGVVTLTVQGLAQNAAIVKVYEDGIYQGETTATASGFFTFTYASTRVGVVTTTLSAAACAPSNPDSCSDPDEVHLTPQRSFWDPQRSYWDWTVDPEHGGGHIVHRFRSPQGLFTTQDALGPRLPGYEDSTLHLYTCIDLDSVWVVVDDIPFYPLPRGAGRPEAPPVPGEETIIRIVLPGPAANPCSWLNATRGMDEWSDSACRLIDPDGYIFDVVQGFDPMSPTLHAVAGVTVTCYISLTQWGGWVPWPAQLYDQQVNPQVTDESGYFAFFTPPGHYYLQVEGIPGYQSWRSPVIEVITEIVHVNVPLTPWPEGNTFPVTLDVDGPQPAVITVPAGSAVEWAVELSGVIPPEEIMRWVDNPPLRPLSSLDPLGDTAGWDGGMMAPGQVYRRRFTRPGTYTYGDGLGHSGQVSVLPYRIYLPVVLRGP